MDAGLAAQRSVDPGSPADWDTGHGSCRFCGAPLSWVFVDLGSSPLANSYRTREQLAEMEPHYPLRAMLCGSCLLVQLDEYETPDEIFSEYAYFSSYSTSWLEHCRRYVEMAIERFELDGESQVIELASNDGYLLQYFAEEGIPVLGIEPAANVAAVAEQRGIRTMVKFFGRATGREVAAMMRADILIANNVLPHVPDLNDFVAGFPEVLAPDGVVTLEFPHLVRLMEANEFDTIYHEHFSYFTFLTVQRIFSAHGLSIFDVEELSTHGGSLRVYACRAERGRAVSERATVLAEREREGGYDEVEAYTAFGDGVRQAKWELLELLIGARREGKRIAAYGAPAKGNTLLNYCGIGTDLIEFTADLNPHKQGRFLPGSHIPIREPDAIRRERPDIVFILPWNLREEITEQLSYVRDWGGRFLIRSPRLELID
jgi:SAM-dependent methyltransferase